MSAGLPNSAIETEICCQPALKLLKAIRLLVAYELSITATRKLDDPLAAPFTQSDSPSNSAKDMGCDRLM